MKTVTFCSGTDLDRRIHLEHVVLERVGAADVHVALALVLARLRDGETRDRVRLVLLRSRTIMASQ